MRTRTVLAVVLAWCIFITEIRLAWSLLQMIDLSHPAFIGQAVIFVGFAAIITGGAILILIPMYGLFAGYCGLALLWDIAYGLTRKLFLLPRRKETLLASILDSTL
jgi:hypothetical protein